VCPGHDRGRLRVRRPRPPGDRLAGGERLRRPAARVLVPAGAGRAVGADRVLLGTPLQGARPPTTRTVSSSARAMGTRSSSTATSGLSTRSTPTAPTSGPNPSGGVSTYLENLVGPQNCAYVSYALGFSPLGSLPDWSTGLALCNGQGRSGWTATISFLRPCTTRGRPWP
jgi:hypothetical protein